MSRARAAHIKAIDAANYRLFEEALGLCYNKVSELARRLNYGGGMHYPATTVYGWRARGRVPPAHADALKKIIRARAPRKRERGRSAEARA